MTYKDVKALFERPDVDDTAIDEHLGRAPEDLSFALNRAGFAGRLDLLACVLRHGPSPGMLNNALVNTAGRAGGADVVRALLSAGADPGGLPLWAAARADAADTVRLLLAAGANPDVVVPEPFEADKCKHPLTAAARAGAVAAVAALLENDADPNVLTPTLRRPVIGWSRRLSDHPRNEGTEHLAPEERAAAFGLNRPGDKLGGWPNWVQDPDYPVCRQGEHRLDRLLLQLDSNRGVPHMWGDNGVAVILQCSEHRDELAFTWQSG